MSVQTGANPPVDRTAGANAEPIWFASYPPGVPKTIDPDAFPSLPAMLIEACTRHAERPAFECLGARMSYAEWERDSRDFAAFLVEEVGMPARRPRRDHAAEHAGLSGGVSRRAARRADRRQRQSALHAARTGAAARRFRRRPSSSSWRISPTSSKPVIAETQIRHVVVARLGDFVPALKRWAFNFANSYIRHAVPAVAFRELHHAAGRLRAARRARAMRTPSRAASAPALLQYTGGTTGVPKGAMLTHRNLIANTLQCRAWIEPNLAGGAGRVLTPLPLYHIFSLTANMLAFALIGGLNVLVPDPRDLQRLIRTMRTRARHLDVGRQHAVQCADQRAGIRRARFQRAALRDRRRRRGAKRGGDALARDHRQRAGRRLWPDRGFAGRLHQSGRARSSAPSACRCRRPK